MDADDQTIVKIISRDGEEFQLTVAEGEASDLIRDTCEDCGDDEPIEFPIERVNSRCLKKVVAFLKHYKEEPMNTIPTPLGGASFNEVMTQEWYQDFLSDENTDREMLYELLTAANFLGIKPLLDLTCLKVTFRLTGKNADQIREELRLPELTPEEEAAAREDHKWIFEDS